MSCLICCPVRIYNSKRQSHVIMRSLLHMINMLSCNEPGFSCFSPAVDDSENHKFVPIVAFECRGLEPVCESLCAYDTALCIY